MPSEVMLWSTIGLKATICDVRCSGAGFASLFHLVIGKVLVLVSSSEELPDGSSWPVKNMQWQAFVLNPGDEL